MPAGVPPLDPAPTANPAGTRPQRGPRPGPAGLLLALIAPLLLYARTLGFGWLEVSDAPVREATSLEVARGRGGAAGALLYVESLSGSATLARLVTLGLQAASSGLVLALARRLGLARGSSLFVALLFALHPLGSEGVAWLSQRGRLLATFLLLLGAVLVLAPSRGPRRLVPGRLVPGALALLAGLAAEPRFVAFLPWLLLAQRWLGPRAPGPGSALDLGLVFVGALGWLDPTAQPITEFVAAVPRALGGLLSLWLWPAGLSPSHPNPAFDGPADSWLAAQWLLVLLALAAAFAGRARAPRAALGALLFLFLAGSGPRGANLFHETSGHLGGLGLGLVLASLAPAAPASTVAGTLLLLACAGRTWVRLGTWQTEPALQAAALALHPDDGRAQLALARWHAAHGRLSEAERRLDGALAPRSSDKGLAAGVALLRGEIALRRGLIPGQEAQLGEALQHLTRAAREQDAPARVFTRLGEVEQRLGDPGAARDSLARALALDPTEALAHTRLGMVQRELGQLAEARASFERALELAPRSAEAWCGLGLLHAQEERPAEAEAALARALALEPDHPESNAALGRLFEVAGDLPAAEAHYRRSIGVHPDYEDGLYALGALLAARAADEEALRLFRRVLERRPSGRPHVRASLAAARLLLARGERAEPLRLLEAVLAFNPAQAEAQALLELLGETR
jgi:tetratricopeptide (TPR) repeat protein